MRRLIFIPLLLLVACSLPNFAGLKMGFGTKTTKPVAEQPQQAIPSGVIETKTLAPLGQTVPVTPKAATNPAPLKYPPKTQPNATLVPISPEQTACLAKGGQWGKAGKLAAMTCYIPSKDAGKSCSKQSDCSSQCLARSKTCAPIWPIFGCSEILQNDGSLVTLCID